MKPNQRLQILCMNIYSVYLFFKIQFLTIIQFRSLFDNETRHHIDWIDSCFTIVEDDCFVFFFSTHSFIVRFFILSSSSLAPETRNKWVYKKNFFNFFSCLIVLLLLILICFRFISVCVHMYPENEKSKKKSKKNKIRNYHEMKWNE